MLSASPSLSRGKEQAEMALIVSGSLAALSRHAWRRRVRKSRCMMFSNISTESKVSEGVKAEQPSTVQHSVISDILADSFLNTFNNVFLNTIESVRTQHLTRVLENLRNFAARVPAKYRQSIQKALSAEGFLSFMLARASVSLLCAKATLPRSSAPGLAHPQLTKAHEDLATVVEELYIAAMLHAEQEWEMEIKADGKTFVAVATSFASKIAAPSVISRPNIQSAMAGLGANVPVWSKYGFDLLRVAFGESLDMIFKGTTSKGSASAVRVDQRKVSLLGGCSLYATAQWAMANVDSRKCRKAIAATISKFSDGQLCKRENLWNCQLGISEYLELEKLAGVAAFFQTSAECAAYMNRADDGIAQELGAYGADVGLIIGLFRNIRPDDIEWAVKTGKITAPIIFALQECDELRPLLERRLAEPGDLKRSRDLIQTHGVEPTMCLIRRIGARAVARLEVLEDTPEKKTLITLTQGIACISEEACSANDIDQSIVCAGSGEFMNSWQYGQADVFAAPDMFDMQIQNLRLRAQLRRREGAARANEHRMESIKEALSAADPATLSASFEAPAMNGLGLKWDPQELEWLLFLGMNKQVPTSDEFDVQAMLTCVQHDREQVQLRLLSIPDAAVSNQLQVAVERVFKASGKCLRSALCLLVHRMLRMEASPVGGHLQAASNEVLTLATAIEVIHSASLVHDDVLDDAEYRRQDSTVHKLFGHDTAVLTGDFLFAHASAMVESLEDDEVTRLVSLVIEEFGYGELSQGALKFKVDVTVFEYLKKTFYKTASLMAAACRASAVLTGMSSQVCDAMYSYGFYMGMAFQIADDILDFTATGVEQLGKPADCADLKDGNLTAPVILCLRGSEELGIEPAPCAQELQELIKRKFSQEGDFARAVDLIHEHDGIEKAFKLADQMADKALQALALVSRRETDASRALASLARWAVRRSS